MTIFIHCSKSDKMRTRRPAEGTPMHNKPLIVDVNEIARVKNYLRQINRVPIKDIVWMQGKNGILPVDAIAMEEFRFTGLSNTEWPAFADWI